MTFVKRGAWQTLRLLYPKDNQGLYGRELRLSDDELMPFEERLLRM